MRTWYCDSRNKLEHGKDFQHEDLLFKNASYDEIPTIGNFSCCVFHYLAKIKTQA